MENKNCNFSPYHLVFECLSEQIRAFVEDHHIRFREFTLSTRMDNRKLSALKSGKDLHLNFYLRFLDYASTYFITPEEFWACVKEFVWAALRDIRMIMDEQEKVVIKN